ncbi:MAG: fasciclin domain-containing protein, partial [Candidatus Poseidoniaceae archaeon]|nr:fasciclin domain-containing protein [Candidatus Poseidoniaceae archaeon]
MSCLLASSIPISSADSTQDIPTNAAGTGIHDTLVAALAHVDLVTTLEGTGPFTVFAPTDQAFTDAGVDLANFQTAEEKAVLTDILLYHVVSGAVPASAVTDGMLAEMVNGDKTKFTVSGTVSINDATVIQADVQASNGIIHVIDKVLTPPVDIPATAQTTGIHNTLVDAVIQADLLATLQTAGPFTLFAPTDQAFTDAGIDLAALDTTEGKAALADILLYHVVTSEVPASAITDGMLAEMANGDKIKITA